MMVAALLAASIVQIAETPRKPVIDGWAEPPVWSRAEPVLVGRAACRALWDRDALYIYLDGVNTVELIVNTSNVRSDRLTHLDRRYLIETGSMRGTAMAGVEIGYTEGRVELRLPWDALGGINGQISVRLADWAGEFRLMKVPVWVPAPAAARRGTVFFADDFGPTSRGERISRYVSGYRPARWVQIDEHAWDDPRRGLWNIPEKENVLVQSGRSEPSWLFIGKPLPPNAVNYDIEFLQCREDNDGIGFVLGATRPDARHDGIEFAYETQVPDSDTTTSNIYYTGALGQGIVVDQAFTHHWIPHRIEVRGRRVRWLQADRVMAEADVPALRFGGFFGIRHDGEQGTRYDDFVIRVIGRGQ